MTAEARSDVYSEFIDKSFVPQLTSRSFASFLGASSQGPIGWRFYTSLEDFNIDYGLPNAKTGFFHYCVDRFFRLGGAGAWVCRVVADDAQYGGKLIQNLDPGGNNTGRGLTVLNLPLTAPNIVNFATAGSANDADDNLLYFYPIGPGSAYDSVAVEIISQNLGTVGGVTLTSFTPSINSPSSLTATTYYYRIGAFNNYGEAISSAEANIVQSAAGKGTRLQWTAIPGAIGYRIYRSTTAGSGYSMVGTVTAAYTEFEDYGVVGVSEVPKAVSSIPLQKTFTVNVYDARQSSSLPRETYEVTLEESTNNQGVQTEITSVINSLSRLVQVKSNVKNMLNVPSMISIAKFSLTGGSSGSVINDTLVNNRLEELKDTKTYQLAALSACGYTAISTQKKLLEVVEARKNGIALLDTPQTLQTAQNSINYRAITLAADTSRGALFNNDHLIRDPYNGLELYIPTSGIVAGLLAFTDKVSNPSYSMAGLNRGVSSDTIALRHTYSDTDKNLMAENGINYFDLERDYGAVLKECYTLQRAFSNLSFLPVRRVLDVAEEYSRRIMLRYLQEPNKDEVITSLMLELSDFYGLMESENMIGGYTITSTTPRDQIALGNRFIESRISPVNVLTRIIHTIVLDKPQATVRFNTQIQNN